MVSNKIQPNIIHLSILDQVTVRKYGRCLFFLRFPNPSKLVAASDSLRNGLQATLERWPFLAGSISATAGEPRKNVIVLTYQDAVPDVVDSGIFAVNSNLSSEDFPSTYQQLENKGMSPNILKDYGGRLSSVPYDSQKERYGDSVSATVKGKSITPSCHVQCLGSGHTANYKSDRLDAKLQRTIACNTAEADDPILMVQANFIAGGLILSFMFQHAVIDGASMRLFFNRFAQCMHSLQVPSKDFDVNRPFRPLISEPIPAEAAKCHEYDFGDAPLPSSRNETAGRILRFSAARIAGLKKDATLSLEKNAIDGWVSTNDCICALMWASVMRARSSRLPTSSVVKFGCVVDVRTKLEPPLGTDYFGNAHVDVVVTAPIQDLTGELRESNGSIAPVRPLTMETIAKTALLIRKGILDVNDAFVRKRLNLFASLEDPSVVPVALERNLDMSNTGLFTSSWIDYGADAEFNIPGTTTSCAEYIRKPWFEGGFSVLPRKSGTKGDADWEVQIGLSVEDMGRLCSTEELGGWAAQIID